MDIIVKNKESINGEFKIPGDKSISHRSIILGAISSGKTEIENFLMGDDCLSTIDCFRKMGINIEIDEKITVHGKGLRGLRKPISILDVGNSGTTIRLMTGLLSSQYFKSEITGDSSIQKRPMDRIVNPLRSMGANIESKEGNLAPLKINGKDLNPIEYTLPVASAQIKSSLILAGIYSKGISKIIEPEITRDHTEIMINYFGGNIERENNTIIVNPVSELEGKNVYVPSDISSAAYFIVAGSILKDSHILLKNIGINPTRTGIITALKQMNGNIEIENERIVSGELIGDIRVKSADLNSITLSGSIIPLMIDEIPILVIAALFAKGTSIIKDAQELKVKESNRINAMVTEINKMGGNIKETDDGMIIEGNAKLNGAIVESYMDHRIAMSLAIAGLKTKGETTIINGDCVNISFPDFYNLLESI